MENYTNSSVCHQTEESNLDCDYDIINLVDHNGTCSFPRLGDKGYTIYDSLSKIFGSGTNGELMDEGLMASSGSNVQEKNGMECEQLSSASTVEHQNNEQNEQGNIGSTEDKNHQADEM